MACQGALAVQPPPGGSLALATLTRPPAFPAYVTTGSWQGCRERQQQSKSLTASRLSRMFWVP